MAKAALARVLSCPISVALLAVATSMTLLVHGVARVGFREGVSLGATRCRLANLPSTVFVRGHRQVLPGCAVDGALQGGGASATRGDVADFFAVGESPPSLNDFSIGELCKMLRLAAVHVMDSSPLLSHVGHIGSLIAKAKMLEPDTCRYVAAMQDVLGRRQDHAGVQLPRNSMCSFELPVVVVEVPVATTTSQQGARPEQAWPQLGDMFGDGARSRPGREPLITRRLVRSSLVHAAIITSAPQSDAVRH